MLRTGKYEPAANHNGHGNGNSAAAQHSNGNGAATGDAATTDTLACPKCGGATWDNSASKKNPRAPDFKCKKSDCDGVIWPAKQSAAAPAASSQAASGSAVPF